MRIGITGHMNLTPRSVDLIFTAIRAQLASYAANGLTGVSCIAAGADSLFARAVLDVGGDLVVILPAADYRERKVQPEHATTFDHLVNRATEVRTMPYEVSNRDAYEAANEELLSSIDLLFAVWNGTSPPDKGGTGAAVESARSRGIPVDIIWPDGAERA